MKEPKPNDYSFADVAATFAIEIAKGNTIHQKFTCGAKNVDEFLKDFGKAMKG